MEGYTVNSCFAAARIPFQVPSCPESAPGAAFHKQLGFPGAGTRVSRALCHSAATSSVETGRYILTGY